MNVNMNDKSKVVNLCDCSVSWARITSTGDEYIKPKGVVWIPNFEIEAQVANKTWQIAGTDGKGSHALVYIENPELREYLGFDNKEEKRVQLIIDEEKCKQILELKTFSVFKKHVESEIINIYEKRRIIDVARKIKINDYDKIKFLEEYCKMPFKE